MPKFSESERIVDTKPNVRKKEDRVRAVLFPMESFVVEMERIIIWDRPLISGFILVTVNVFFWLTTTCHVLSLMGILGFLAVAIDGLLRHYGPYRKGCGAKSNDGWTELHPELTGIPEISIKIAEMWQTVENKVMNAIELRRRNRPKFFVSSIFILSTLAVLGTCVSGQLIIYCTVTGILTWPALCYHNIFSRINASINDTVEPKTEKKQKGKGRLNRKKNESVAEEEDEELKEFLPIRPVTIARKHYPTHRRTRDDVNQHQSFRDFDLSLQHSDDDLLSSFTRDLGPEMPSIDLNLDSLAPFAPQQQEMPSFDQLDSSLMSQGSGNISYLSADFQPDGEDSDDLTDSDKSLTNSAQDLSVNEVTSNDMAAMLGHIITQGRSTLAFAVSASAPVVGSALTAAATRLGDMAAMVRGTAVSAVGATRQITEQTNTRVSQELNISDIENDFVLIAKEELKEDE